MRLLNGGSGAFARRQLSRHSAALNSALGRLSSGQRIQTSLDDAAGLAVADRVRMRFVSERRAGANAVQGLSQVQTAEGALGQISDVLIRMRELSVQAATDSITDTERGYLDTEYQELLEEVDRIRDSTTFNSQALLDGSTLDYHIGADTADATSGGGAGGVGNGNGNSGNGNGNGNGNGGGGGGVAVTGFAILSVTFADPGTANLGMTGSGVGSKSDAQTAMGTLDTALDTINQQRASLGSNGNRLERIAANSSAMADTLEGAHSRIRDADVAVETARLTRSQVLMQATVSVMSQTSRLEGELVLSLLR
ncbi:MAG: flagellin [Myxococcota bacterium]